MDAFDAMNCNAAMEFCQTQLAAPFFTTRLSLFFSNETTSFNLPFAAKNPYDISKDCEGGLEDTLCYPVTK